MTCLHLRALPLHSTTYTTYHAGRMPFLPCYLSSFRPEVIQDSHCAPYVYGSGNRDLVTWPPCRPTTPYWEGASYLTPSGGAHSHLYCPCARQDGTFGWECWELGTGQVQTLMYQPLRLTSLIIQGIDSPFLPLWGLFSSHIQLLEVALFS